MVIQELNTDYGVRILIMSMALLTVGLMMTLIEMAVGPFLSND